MKRFILILPLIIIMLTATIPKAKALLFDSGDDVGYCQNNSDDDILNIHNPDITNQLNEMEVVISPGDNYIYIMHDLQLAEVNYLELSFNALNTLTSYNRHLHDKGCSISISHDKKQLVIYQYKYLINEMEVEIRYGNSYI